MKDYIKGMYETCIHAEECSKTTNIMNNDICQGCNTYSQKWPIEAAGTQRCRAGGERKGKYIMKTYRDVMQEDGGNLSWCKPVKLEYGGKTAIIAQNERDLAGLQIAGYDIHGNLFDALVKYFGIDEAETLSDLYNYTFDDGDVKATDMDCCNCPWFETCEAMDSEVV